MSILYLMQYIDHLLQIIRRELQFVYVHSSGPGGQNVNKVATAVQLRLNVPDSSLPRVVKERLIKITGKRITTDGLLVIEAKRFRTQEQNRQDALKRLTALLGKALEEPKQHKKTSPTKASIEKRLKAKKRKSEIKRNRQELLYD